MIKESYYYYYYFAYLYCLVVCSATYLYVSVYKFISVRLFIIAQPLCLTRNWY